MAGRIVRIFLSSTFRDFGEERDLLVRKVFPSLRAKLQSRFVDLVDVDLRWGITEEEAERGEVLPICLSEIDRARPYFIGFLGERYGWVPPPNAYPSHVLESQAWLEEHRGGKSVTELEILHGVLNNPHMEGRALYSTSEVWSTLHPKVVIILHPRLTMRPANLLSRKPFATVAFLSTRIIQLPNI